MRLLMQLCVIGGLAVATIQVRAETNELHLPVILPLTGSGAFLGLEEQQALRIIETLTNRNGGINGRPLKFDISDDRSSPQDGVQIATRNLSAGPIAIFGSALVAICNATAPLVRNGPVQFCFSPAIHPVAGSFVFTAGVSSTDTYNVILRYFRQRGLTRLAYIVSTDASGQDAEKAVEEALRLPENSGLAMKVRAHFNPADLSVSAQMAAIADAAPQALLVLTSGTPSGTAFKGLVQAGIDVPTATPYSNMTFAQMDQYAAFLPRQLYFPSGQWPQSGGQSDDEPAVARAKEEFYAAYEQDGHRPDVGATLAWDPAAIVIAALRVVGPDATPAALRAQIAGMAGFAGLNGLYDFRKNPQRGLDESDVVMARWDRGAHDWVVVSRPGGAPMADEIVSQDHTRTGAP